ncbi:YqiA/YcfP family alpha/beta fold hydrolase [Flammeovirgaceae bacterium SG7u.111]|nr:YqiA/YcfP family alpha/beta fold hydrolase [Flammeovirgaceae bacterium SG7u.132]WPO37318.1 YqiA/YcfP family alpha/beta fold hydrolase [Flammeovirgaceae bacterium SG7u.111]
MRILYIHGLDNIPTSSELEILRDKGHDVFSLEFDYRKQVDTFDVLVEYAQTNEIDYIIGASVGGYYGYWLGHLLGKNQLLFNPAMPFRSVRVQSHNIEERRDVGSYVVLGAHDDVIPTNLNLSYFSTKDNVRLITCEWMGHQVDLKTFQEMIQLAGL